MTEREKSVYNSVLKCRNPKVKLCRLKKSLSSGKEKIKIPYHEPYRHFYL